jgi:hypothetical protein
LQLVGLLVSIESGNVRSRQRTHVGQAGNRGARPIGRRQHAAPQRLCQPQGSPRRGTRHLDALGTAPAPALNDDFAGIEPGAHADAALRLLLDRRLESATRQADTA